MQVSTTTTAVADDGNNNLDTISKYIAAMQIEINSSQEYKNLIITILTKFSRYYEHKSFTRMKRDDIVEYLNTLRKTDTQDPMHK